MAKYSSELSRKSTIIHHKKIGFHKIFPSKKSTANGHPMAGRFFTFVFQGLEDFRPRFPMVGKRWSGRSAHA
jgi:hypothetical protein